MKILDDLVWIEDLMTLKKSPKRVGHSWSNLFRKLNTHSKRIGIKATVKKQFL